MFSLCISSLRLESECIAAAAAPSMCRMASIQVTRATGRDENILLLTIQECPELISAFDRNAGRRVFGGGGFRSAYASPSSSSPPNIGNKALRRSVSMHQTARGATPLVVSTLHPIGCDVKSLVVRVRWVTDTMLVVFCRHRSGRWSGLTLVALEEGDGGEEGIRCAAQDSWATPFSSVSIDDGRAWVAHISPVMLRRMVMGGNRQGTVIPLPDELIDVLVHQSVESVREAQVTALSRIDGAFFDHDEDSVEQWIIEGIWGMEEDVFREGTWLQLSSVLASVRFSHCGHGVFRYEVAQRIPLNDNLLTAATQYRCPRWAAAQRLVFVLDEEYQEIKAWSVQSGAAICLMNIPMGYPVEHIFTSDDGGMLFTVHGQHLRIMSTHHLRDVLTPSSIRRRVADGGDCARVFCGDQLQDEQSAQITWDAVGRNTSTEKLQLFRTDTPHAIPNSIPVNNIRRIAVVEDCISVIANTGDSLLMTPQGSILDERNVLRDDISLRTCGVILHVGRPPLPSHVVDLVVYRDDKAGCRAWFASTAIDRDSLLRNEIRFEVSSIAVRLCDLNGWDASHVQDTTLQIALQDSPEQVYLSVEDVFLRETSSSVGVGASPSGNNTNGSQATAHVDIRVRPVSSLQLLCRLVNVITVRFDHCPDDVSARNTLRTLVYTAIRVASLLLDHRAKMLFHSDSESKQPLCAAALEARITEGVPLELSKALTPPIWNDEEEPEELLVKDVYFLMCCIHGLRHALSEIPQGTAITTTMAKLCWAPRRVSKGALLDAAAAASAAATKKGTSSSAASSPSASTEQPHAFRLPAAVPNTWNAFFAFVMEVLLGSSGIALIAVGLREMLPLLSPSVLDAVAAACRTTGARDAVSLQQQLWKLSHVQLMAGLCAEHRVAEAVVVTSLQQLKTNAFRDAVITANTVLVKVYGKRMAREWWKQLAKMTMKKAIRDVVMAHHQLQCSDIASDPHSPFNEAKACETLNVLEQLALSSQGGSSLATPPLTRVLGSRMLFSHGGFVLDGQVAALPPNMSFLLLQDGNDSDSNDGGSDIEDRDNRSPSAVLMRHARTTSTSSSVRVVIGPREVADVVGPPSAAANSTSANDVISLSALTMLKPTQPLPYTEFSLDWISRGYPRNVPLSTSTPGVEWTLLDDAPDVWIGVVLEQALLQLRDAQQPVRSVLPWASLKQDLEPNGLFHESSLWLGVCSSLSYCFRHHDLAAVVWVLDTLFSSIQEANGQRQDSNLSIDLFSRILALFQQTMTAMDKEHAAFPENGMLFRVQKSFCRSAISILYRFFFTKVILKSQQLVGSLGTPEGPPVEMFHELGGDVFTLTHHPHHTLPDHAACFIAQKALSALSSTMPIGAVSIAMKILRRGSPSVWNALSEEALYSSLCTSPSAAIGGEASWQRIAAYLNFQVFRTTYSADVTTSSGLAQWLTAATRAAVFRSRMLSGDASRSQRGESIEYWMSRPLMQLVAEFHQDHGTLGVVNPLLPLLIDELSAASGGGGGYSSGSDRVAAARNYVRSFASSSSLAGSDAEDEYKDACARLLQTKSESDTASASPSLFEEEELIELRTVLKECTWRFSEGRQQQRLKQQFAAAGVDAGITSSSQGMHSNELLFRNRARHDDSADARVMPITDEQVAVVVYNGDTSSTKDSIASLPYWKCVPAVVRTAEEDDAVVVDAWSLLLDSRPITAYLVWMESKPNATERNAVIHAARALGFHATLAATSTATTGDATSFSNGADGRLSLQVAIAAFLRLIDVQEYRRFLIDCNVQKRIAAHHYEISNGPVGSSASSVHLLTPSLLTRHLSSLQRTSSSSVSVVQHQDALVTAVLKALESASQAASPTDPQDIRGKLLALHFIQQYQGLDEARTYFFSSIVSSQMQRGEWIWSLMLAWASGLTGVDWRHGMKQTPTATTLMYMIKPFEGSRFDVDDFQLPYSSLAQQAPASIELLSTLVHCPLSSSSENTQQQQTEALHQEVAFVVQCLTDVMSQSADAAALGLIAECSKSLGVSTCALRCCDTLRSSSSSSPSDHVVIDSITEVVMEVIRSKSIIASTAARQVLSALNAHTAPSCSNEQTAKKKAMLVVMVNVLTLHESLLHRMYVAAQRVAHNLMLSPEAATSDTAAESQPDEALQEVSRFLLKCLCDVHLKSSSDEASHYENGSQDAGSDDGGSNNEDEHLHINLLNVISILLTTLKSTNHPALLSPVISWVTISASVVDGAIAGVSDRCRETAVSFLCIKETVDLFASVFSLSPSEDNVTTTTSSDIMMRCVLRHPKLTPECIQELALVVEANTAAAQSAAGVDSTNRFLKAITAVEELVFTSGLFSCPPERPMLMQVAMETAAAFTDSPSATLNAVVHCLLTHIDNEDLTLEMCSTLIAAASDVKELSTIAVDNVANCDAFVRCLEHDGASSAVSPVILRILLGTMSESDQVKLVASTTEGGPLTRASMLPPSVVAAVMHTARHRPSFRMWLRRHFFVEISASDASAAAQEGSPGRTYEDPIGYIEDYVPSSLVDEARQLADVASRDRQAAKTAEFKKAEANVLWQATNFVLSRCMSEDGIMQLIPFFASHPSDPLSSQHLVDTLQKLLTQCVFCVLRSHFVPLMHDIAQRIYARDKQRYPTALEDFEKTLETFFFPSPNEGTTNGSGGGDGFSTSSGGHNFFGLGEASGWLCKERIHAIASLLEHLQPVLDAHRQHHAFTPNVDATVTRSSSISIGVSRLVTSFAKGIIGELNRFQSVVHLPSRSHYPRLFLEPLVMMIVQCCWILEEYYDERLAADVSKELSCVMNVSSGDGDFEQVRRIVFAVGSVTLLEYIANGIPVSHIVTLANSSSDFQLQPLHQSTMRVAIMSYFDRLSHNDDFMRLSRVEMTTLYANFRHFTALGERLEHEAHHMLQGFVQQYSTQKKGLLDNQKDALRRQNKMLDEIDMRFLSAANFFIQDGQFERCLACIRDLHLISVQKKTSSIKILGLSQEQAVQTMSTQLDTPQDIIAVGYGYNITANDDWAGVLYRQIVLRGKKEVLTAYRAQTVSFPPMVRKRMVDLWKADAASQKESSKRQLWQWIEEETLKPSTGR